MSKVRFSTKVRPVSIQHESIQFKFLQNSQRQNVRKFAKILTIGTPHLLQRVGVETRWGRGMVTNPYEYIKRQFSLTCIRSPINTAQFSPTQFFPKQASTTSNSSSRVQNWSDLNFPIPSSDQALAQAGIRLCYETIIPWVHPICLWRELQT